MPADTSRSFTVEPAESPFFTLVTDRIPTGFVLADICWLGIWGPAEPQQCLIHVFLTGVDVLHHGTEVRMPQDLANVARGIPRSAHLVAAVWRKS